MSRYTEIPEKIKEEYKDKMQDLELGETPKRSISKKNIGYWMKHTTGLTPYTWQYYVMKRFIDSIRQEDPENQIWCTARQFMGKTTAICTIALHSVLFNTMPIKSKGGFTHIGIVSRSDKQSKKIIANIRNIMSMADRHVQRLSGGKYKNYVSNMLGNKPSDSNNKSELTFRRNGGDGKKLGVISTYPPTDAIVGETLSALFCDEAAIYDDEDFFLRAAFPTLNMTNGPAILASTPRGPQGYFYKLFDPNNEFNIEGKKFRKVWFNWEYIEKERFIEKVKDKRDMYMTTGKEKLFEQEYNAKFITTANSFFDNETIEKSEDPEMSRMNSYDKKCDMGIDFGVTNSQTVITISMMDNDGIIRLLYHYMYEAGKDDSLLEDVQDLYNKFNIQRIIVDDCSQGHHWIKKMERAGLPIKKMGFKADKTKKFTQFRAAMNDDKIRFYPNKSLKNQLRVIKAKEGVRSTKITSPQKANDDFVDSFIMSSYYYLDGKKGVKMHSWDESNYDKDNVSSYVKKYKKRKDRYGKMSRMW